MKQIHEAVQALESDMIWAAILDFVKKTKKTPRKNYQKNSGPICILQIFRNNPSRGFWVRAEETSCGGVGFSKKKQ